MRWVIGGGERTPEQHVRAFSDFFTRGRYIDAYGMTETLSGDTLMEAGREIEKIGSVGRALAHVEVEIRDADGRGRAGRDGRNLPSWAEDHARLLARPGENVRRILRRLVAQRRRRPSR